MKDSKNLKLVTLTVNNVCNMSCSHCYLQLNKASSDWINDSILDKVLASSFDHLAVVGKEPLFNQEHIRKLGLFAKKIKESGKTISIITNGKNLNLANADLLNNIDFIDISFDGGKNTYQEFRRADFNELKEKIQKVYSSGFNRINVLHSVHSGNIDNIEDMMSVSEIIPFKKIMFSPYIETENYGKNTVSKTNIKKLFTNLSNCKTFIDSKNAIVNVDLHHLEQANMTPRELTDLAKEFGLSEKLVLHKKNLLPFGVVRVTYEGEVLTPSQSLNPIKYSEGLKLTNFSNLNEAWKELVSQSIQ